MRIGMGIGGDVLGEPIPAHEVVEQARHAEADGFSCAWSVHLSRGLDTLSVMAVAGTQTNRIDLGVGVVPTYPRHPLALAQQAATTQAVCGGRLTLGVGVSHRPVIEGMHGLPYLSPAAHMREYLSVLEPALTDGAVTFAGEFYQVDGGFTVLGTSKVSVVIAALGPKMVQVAGECSDGVVTWMVGPQALATRIVGPLQQAATGAGRAAPRVIAGVQVAVCDDVDLGRAAAEKVFERYAGMENYQRMFERDGVPSPGSLAVVGTEGQVEQQLRAYADVGVTELWPTVFGVGADPGASVRRTAAVLAELAPTL